MSGRALRYVCIVAHGQPDLLDLFTRFFADDADVEVVVDRRIGRRRSEAASAGWERRLAQRRRQPDVDAHLRKQGWALVRLPWPRAGSGGRG